MSWLREPNAEPIPGYRLIEPLGSGGFGEVWKCEAPGGLFLGGRRATGQQIRQRQPAQRQARHAQPFAAVVEEAVGRADGVLAAAAVRFWCVPR